SRETCRGAGSRRYLRPSGSSAAGGQRAASGRELRREIFADQLVDATRVRHRQVTGAAELDVERPTIVCGVAGQDERVVEGVDGDAVGEHGNGVVGAEAMEEGRIGATLTHPPRASEPRHGDRPLVGRAEGDEPADSTALAEGPDAR